MTVGSFNRSTTAFDTYYSIVWDNLVWTKSWNGTDRPKAQRFPKETVYTFSINGEPGWFYRKRPLVSRPTKRERDVDHAYSMTSIYRSEEWYDFPRSDGSTFHGRVMQACGQPSWIAANLFDANDQIRLVGKLREKLQGSDFNMSVFLGEGHQALRLVGDSAIRIAKGLHHLRKGDFAGVARSLFEGTSRSPLKPYSRFPAFKPTTARMSSHWLEVQYGWLPLLEDAKAGAEFLAHKLNAPAQTTYRMSIRREQSLPYTTAPTGFKTYVTPCVKTHRRTLIARVREGPSLAAQLGLLDPQLVAWELVPFSFVADWFIPIGQWMDARASVSHLEATYVTSDKQSSFSGPVPGTGKRANWHSANFSRTLSNTADVPMPSFKSLAKVASWQHCANALALVTGISFGGSRIR